MFGKKVFLTVFFILIFSSVIPENMALAEITVIKVHFRHAPDMLPLVETMLSPEGRVAVDTETNSFIISDGAESLKRIRKFLAKLDKPVQQFKIRFRFQEESLSKSKGFKASGRVSGKGWSVTGGGREKDGVRLSTREKRVNLGRKSESFITVLSGRSAYIRVGKEIPYTERWVYLSRRYAHFVETIGFQRIETGMEVKPVISGDNVQIEIIPRISYEEAGNKGVILFTEASTRLIVPRGKWITIGGSRKESSEVIRNIFSRGGAEKRTTLSLSLMVEP